MLFHLLFLIRGVVGGGELLRDFFSKQVLEELGLFDAGFPSESSGFDFDFTFFCDIDNDLFHGLFLRLLIVYGWLL